MKIKFKRDTKAEILKYLRIYYAFKLCNIPSTRPIINRCVEDKSLLSAKSALTRRSTYPYGASYIDVTRHTLF